MRDALRITLRACSASARCLINPSAKNASAENLQPGRRYESTAGADFIARDIAEGVAPRALLIIATPPTFFAIDARYGNERAAPIVRFRPPPCPACRFCVIVATRHAR